ALDWRAGNSYKYPSRRGDDATPFAAAMEASVMSIRWLGLVLTLAVLGLVCRERLFSQDPDVPRGVEVQARGPIHEAFATPTAEAKPTYGVPKKPPAPIEEMPPEERPEGDAVWIGGCWAWGDDRAEVLWVSGC